MQATRILLADAEILMREAMRCSLDACAGLRVIAVSDSVADSVRIAESVVFDVIVARESCPGIDVLRLAESLHARGIDKLVCIAACCEPVYLRHLINAGVKGLLSASCNIRELEMAIGRVASGCSHLSSPVAGFLVHGREKMAISPLERLSRREVQVLRLMSGGLKSQEIGRRLGLSPKTVSTYRSRICAKLELAGSAELVSVARRLAGVESGA